MHLRLSTNPYPTPAIHRPLQLVAASAILASAIALPAQSELIVTESIRFEKGAPMPARLVIAADNIVIDGGGAELIGPARAGQPKTGTGAGIRSTGHSGIVLKNLRVRGFRSGLVVDGGRGWRIENCDFSDNYHDPEFGWGDGTRVGGMVITGARGFQIRRCKAMRNWNGLDLWGCDDFLVGESDFSHCSNVCLKLWTASRNLIRHNNLSYGLRIRTGEVHARDSTCVLIESGSDDNIFSHNDITHGGDGVFIRVLNGWVSKRNVFVENDCSFANNNGFESWSPDNTYLRNKANHCSYGFWLGGSDHTVLIGNEASHNGLETGFHNAPESDFKHGGIVIVHGSGTHTLIDGNTCIGNNGGGIVLRGDLASRGAKWKMRNVIVQRNKLERNLCGLFARFADGLHVSSNRFVANERDELLEEVTHLVRFGPAADGARRPTASIEGPSRVTAGQSVGYRPGPTKAAGGEAWEHEWSVDGAWSTAAELRHTFRRIGMHRVGLVVRAAGVASLSYRDVYVVAAAEHAATETGLAQFGAEQERAGRGGVEAVGLRGDGTAIVGRTALRVEPNPYSGGDVEVFLPRTAGPPLDLSGVDRIEFWLKFQNPNLGGFQGPNPTLRLHASHAKTRGTPSWLYTPEHRGLPRNLLGDLPYSEARDGWLLVSIPLAGGAAWRRSLAFAGARPPFVAERLKFTTVVTAFRTETAAALATDGESLYCAADPGGRIYRSVDGVDWQAIRDPRTDLRVRPEWINGMLTFAPGLGERGALLITAPARQDGDTGHGNRQLIVFDLATQRWRWHKTVTAMAHGATLVGDQLFGLAHAVAGNYGGPLCRVAIGAAAEFDDHSVVGGIRGDNAGWFSRAAQLASLDGKVYGIKNDWQTPSPKQGAGDRLFVFDPAAYRASQFAGGGRWDPKQWRAAQTPAEDLGALPFEVGHGATLLGLPKQFGGLVGDRGGLFILAGCSPSDHEGHGSPSARWAIYDVAGRRFTTGELPGPTGAGTSACLHGGRIVIKRGGVRSVAADREVWLVDPLPAALARKLRERQVDVVPDLRAIERVSLHFDSSGQTSFTVWIDGLRFVGGR